MKKIIAILITMTMLFSALSIMPAFAGTITVNDTTWTQNFDNTNDGGTWNKAVSEAYASGGRFGTAGNDSYGIYTTKDGSGCIKLAPTKLGNGGLRGGKVFIDQSAFEVGKTYVITMDAYLENHTSDTMPFNVKVLNGTGSTTSSTGSNTLKNGQWTQVSTPSFVMTADLIKTTGGINARVDSTSWAYTSDTDRTTVYIDNFKVQEVTFTSIFGDKVDENGGKIDFDDIDNANFHDDIDYETNTTGTRKITNEKDFNGDGKSLLFTPFSKITSRLVLSNVFNKEENLGRSYVVSMQIFPVSNDENVTGKLRIGSKATEVDVNTRWGSDVINFTIGAKGSGANLITNQWNKVEFYYTGGYYNNNVNELFLDGIGFTFNISGNELFIPYYVDEIEVTPINYFAAETETEKATTAEAGYYAETFDSEEKEGVISIDAYVLDNTAYVPRYQNVGLYIYRIDDPSKEATVTLTLNAQHLRDSFVNANGFINVTIEEIGQEFFGTSIVALPFITVRGETFYGDAFTYCVNDAGENLKWLGSKPVTK